jgi:RNA-directed DNA polymerase
VDKESIADFEKDLRNNLYKIWNRMSSGSYVPPPVRPAAIPKKAGAGERKLGIPCVSDRVAQTVWKRYFEPMVEPHFHEDSYSYRPHKSALDAVEVTRKRCWKYAWVLELDLKGRFDRVNHDKLMSLVGQRIEDKRVITLIHRYLKSGVLVGEEYHETPEGTPQGGPLSPLLANLLLDGLDKELERRGHCFVRYADDCNIYVRTARSGRRVMAGVTEYLKRKLKLSVNEAKSAVDRPWKRTFLGFSFTGRRPNRRRTSEKAIARFKAEIRRITYRTRGVSTKQVIHDVRSYLVGWKLYFGFSEAKSAFKELDSWLHRRLRCYLWKQWGRAGYRRLRERGVSSDLAWNTAKSAHGPWRLSRSPALSIALPRKYFVGMGLPLLYERSR